MSRWNSLCFSLQPLILVLSLGTSEQNRPRSLRNAEYRGSPPAAPPTQPRPQRCPRNHHGERFPVSVFIWKQIPPPRWPLLPSPGRLWVRFSPHGTRSGAAARREKRSPHGVPPSPREPTRCREGRGGRGEERGERGEGKEREHRRKKRGEGEEEGERERTERESSAAPLPRHPGHPGAVPAASPSELPPCSRQTPPAGNGAEGGPGRGGAGEPGGAAGPRAVLVSVCARRTPPCAVENISPILIFTGNKCSDKLQSSRRWSILCHPQSPATVLYRIMFGLGDYRKEDRWERITFTLQAVIL